ncbi:MAG: hypothetical protein ABII06_22095 [Pseudomonadota bacterium]
MDNFSRLSGTAPITPLSGRVWRVQKKRKMDDRKGQDREKDRRHDPDREEDGAMGASTANEQATAPDPEVRDFEGEIGYSSSGIKKSVKRKIDVVI